MTLRLWKLDVVSRERPFTRTGTHRSLPRRAANPAKVKFTFPAWVTTADIGIRDRPSRSITSATRTQSARSSNADIFTIAPLDQHLAGKLLLFNSIEIYSNEKIFFQSFFMLMMVQLFFFASA
jgi:hypothetical protein